MISSPMTSHGMEEVGLLRGNDERLKATSGGLKVIGRIETLKQKKKKKVSGRWGEERHPINAHQSQRNLRKTQHLNFSPWRVLKPEKAQTPDPQKL